MVKLILKFNEAVIKEIPIETEAVTIGRSEENDITIDNMAVSGKHAKLIHEGDAYILYDLNSLNGTFVNGAKTSKTSLKNNDQIIIGKHTLIFKDDSFPEKKAPITSSDMSATGETIILDTRKQRELLSQAAPEQVVPSKPAPASAPLAPPSKPRPQEKIGVIAVITGHSAPRELDLTKRLTILGKSSDADIRVGGLFVGKTAALINRRPQGYFLSYSEGISKPKVNGKSVTSQVQLNDGDQIELGDSKMQFYIR
ncbi:MAG: FHA domain-containing protein [Deltaproteobacteria bacterium]|nr:FHA domain-containing protein [Deltaproteobacteria bacterium]MBW2308843.1 FHA domain-containing protein [Deltaproteobacteria bacterium]